MSSSVAYESCTVLINPTDKANVPTSDEILKGLEDSDDKVKVKSLKSALHMMLSGEPIPRILMTVIRFCINTEDHEMKKLLMLFWEIVPKYDVGSKLLPEMILVCNALRNDLNHSNEYVRGAMLRFLCKLREAEIIEPLVPSIKACLEHRHSYVRKNAALAIYHIHKYHGQTLIPDGASLMGNFISTEAEVGARRNAFLMLFNEAEDISIDFLASHADEFDRYGDGFALLVLELTRKVCRRDPEQKSRFVHFLFQLLASTSAAVSYEAAWTLVSLSSSPTAVRAAAGTYTTLLSSQSDNNVKLIVLERLAEMKQRDSRVLRDVVMDLLRALASPNIDICKKTLQISLDLVSYHNIEEVVQVLKREIIRTKESDLEKGIEYRSMLINAIHSCVLKFSEIANTVVDLLMEFIGLEGGLDVIIFLRAILFHNENMRPEILTKLLAMFAEIKNSQVLSVALWIIGEFSETEAQLEAAFDDISHTIGAPPFVDLPITKNESELAADQALTTDIQAKNGNAIPAAATVLRRLICNGDINIATVAASTLTKLSLKTISLYGKTSSITKARIVSTLQIICGLAQEFEAVQKKPESKSNGTAASTVCAVGDCLERLTMFSSMILDPDFSPQVKDSFVHEGRSALAKHLEYCAGSIAWQSGKVSFESYVPSSQPDDLITWRQLKPMTNHSYELDLGDSDDMKRATNTGENGVATDGASTGFSENDSHIKHVYQLSGFADPVYAEAHVTVHDYDILVDVVLYNRTAATLTNLTVELYTMGDLKLVERPQSLSIGPHDNKTIHANIKVSSTETGHIFGTIVYDNASSAEKTYINLNNIHLDIMDYIRPASSSDESFRAMWAEFEWENKVAITTSISNLEVFLEHIVNATNMRCLTPRASLSGCSTFLAANLYAKSIFGEDALVNVSMEKKEDGKLGGYIRIRSKTQGIALSLGDRITAVQRSTVTSSEGGEATAPTS